MLVTYLEMESESECASPSVKRMRLESVEAVAGLRPADLEGQATPRYNITGRALMLISTMITYSYNYLSAIILQYWANTIDFLVDKLGKTVISSGKVKKILVFPTQLRKSIMFFQ